jgi:hypothetical protein
MKDDSQKSLKPENLTVITDRVERGISKFFRKNPDTLLPLAVLTVVIVLSPLAVFFLDGSGAKDWSETVKNVVESVAVLGGLFAVIKWVNERRDRATDILFQLMDKFEKAKTGKQMIDDNSEYRKIAGALTTGVELKESCVAMDELLDFYILLHGVRHARQVPDAALSVCFRYWLAHYFHKERLEFRLYVEAFYPTLTRWLREDCKDDLPFFRPHRLFKDFTDDEFIAKCRNEPIP